MRPAAQGHNYPGGRLLRPSSDTRQGLPPPIGWRHAVLCAEGVRKVRLAAEAGTIGNLRNPEFEIDRICKLRVTKPQALHQDDFTDRSSGLVEDPMQVADRDADGSRNLSRDEQRIVQVLANVSDATPQRCGSNRRSVDCELARIGFDRDSDQIDQLPSVGSSSVVRDATHLVSERSDKVSCNTPHTTPVAVWDEQMSVELRDSRREQRARYRHVLHIGAVRVFPDEWPIGSIQDRRAGRQMALGLALSQAQVAPHYIDEDDDVPIVLTDVSRSTFDEFAAAGDVGQIEIADA